MADATILRIADLPKGQTRSFALSPDAATCTRLAEDLGLSALRKVSFKGQISPRGKHDWAIHGTLGATVVQPCVVTLVPVTTRLEQEVERHYVANFTIPEGDEVEMPDDVTREALPQSLDLMELLHEELALGLPPFPRAKGAELGQVVHAEEGTVPLGDDDVKPFAGLAALKARMSDDDS